VIACRRKEQLVYSEAVPETIAAYSRALVKIVSGIKTTFAAHPPKLLDALRLLNARYSRAACKCHFF
jgi:hypothetical protein